MKIKTIKNEPFASYQDALDSFERIVSSRNIIALQEMFENKISKINTSKKMLNSTEVKKFNLWFSRCQLLPTPWPENHIKNLISITSTNERFPEVIHWIRNSSPKAKLFIKTLISWGLDPSSYIPSANVTLLGYAAYSLNDDFFSFLHTKTSHPSSRLILSTDHLSPSAPGINNLIGSSLLHRLAERCHTLEGTRLKSAISIVTTIAQNDPDSVLWKNKAGDYPDNYALFGPLKDVMLNARLARLAHLSKTHIIEVIDSGQIYNSSSLKKM